MACNSFVFHETKYLEASWSRTQIVLSKGRDSKMDAKWNRKENNSHWCNNGLFHVQFLRLKSLSLLLSPLMVNMDTETCRHTCIFEHQICSVQQATKFRELAARTVSFRLYACIVNWIIQSHSLQVSLSQSTSGSKRRFRSCLGPCLRYDRTLSQKIVVEE
jgi:hypothetical protein